MARSSGPGRRNRRGEPMRRERALRTGSGASSGQPLRIAGRPGEGRLVELEGVAFGIPEEAERAVGGSDDLLVTDAGPVEAADREREVVDDQLWNDTTGPVVLRLAGRRAARDEREARPLRRVEPDEGPCPVEEAQPDDVAIERQLGLGILDEDQGAADLADVPEGLDHRHGIL